MVIVTTGSRRWTDESIVKKRLQELATNCAMTNDTLIVVVGYNPHTKTPKGVDRMVYKWCESLGINVIPEPADWSKGRGAGFQRNIRMLEVHKPDMVVAFRARGKSNGTDHCVKEAHKRDITVEVINEA